MASWRWAVTASLVVSLAAAALGLQVRAQDSVVVGELRNVPQQVVELLRRELASSQWYVRAAQLASSPVRRLRVL